MCLPQSLFSLTSPAEFFFLPLCTARCFLFSSFFSGEKKRTFLTILFGLIKIRQELLKFPICCEWPLNGDPCAGACVRVCVRACHLPPCGAPHPAADGEN